MVRKRRELKKDPGVMDEIQKFWELVCVNAI